MLVPGRVHWDQVVTVLNYTAGGVDPVNPAGDPIPESVTIDPARERIMAFVESMDRATVIRSQLDATREHWFLRIEPGARLTQQGNRIRWHTTTEGDVDLTITSVNAIPGEDIELTVTRVQPD